MPYVLMAVWVAVRTLTDTTTAALIRPGPEAILHRNVDSDVHIVNSGLVPAKLLDTLATD
jgi:hypothetical protein